jgi:uncharacterized protein YaiE (UPF0345 family)
LAGEFKQDGDGSPKFNTYEQGMGLVVRRPLMQRGEIIIPTIGLVCPQAGSYKFKIGGNTETFTILEGALEANVNGGPFSTLERDGTIVAPAGSELCLRAFMSAYYVCHYKPNTD